MGGFAESGLSESGAKSSESGCQATERPLIFCSKNYRAPGTKKAPGGHCPEALQNCLKRLSLGGAVCPKRLSLCPKRGGALQKSRKLPLSPATAWKRHRRLWTPILSAPAVSPEVRSHSGCNPANKKAEPKSPADFQSWTSNRKKLDVLKFLIFTKLISY